MDLTLADLADLLRAHPALAASLRRDGLTAVEGRPEALPFLRGFRDYLERYGMRGAGEIDLSRPRWRDDPAMLLSAVLGGLSRGGAGAGDTPPWPRRPTPRSSAWRAKSRGLAGGSCVGSCE